MHVFVLLEKVFLFKAFFPFFLFSMITVKENRTAFTAHVKKYFVKF